MPKAVGEYSLDFELTPGQDPFVNANWIDFVESMRIDANGYLRGRGAPFSENIVLFTGAPLNQDSFAAEFEVREASITPSDYIGIKITIANGNGYFLQIFGDTFEQYRQPAGVTSYDTMGAVETSTINGRDLIRLEYSYDGIADEATLVTLLNGTEIMTRVDTAPIRGTVGDPLRVGLQTYTNDRDNGFYSVGIDGLAEDALIDYTGSGGVGIGGEADFAIAYAPPLAGGIEIGGAADLANAVVPLVSGGVQVGGAATIAFISVFGYVGAGGVVVGGVATVEYSSGILIDFVGTGGVGVGGSATVTFNTSVLLDFTGTGGVVVGGAAIVSVNTGSSPAKEMLLFETVRALMLEGLAMQGITHVVVRPNYQPTQQGAESKDALYFHIITDYRYGHTQRKTLIDGDGNITEKNTQQMETTFQVDARVTHRPTLQVDLSKLTAGDLMQLAADIFSSDWAIGYLRKKGIGLHRIQATRTPFVVNESDRFDAAPSFDVVLTHKRSLLWSTPAITGFEHEIHRV